MPDAKRRGTRPVLKLGYVHIPKCGGTALSDVIYDAVGSRHLHVANVVRPGKTPRSFHSLQPHSFAWLLAQSVPFLSGHIGYRQMRRLDRTSIFSVLRDPALRLFSLYSYHSSRVLDPETNRDDPNLELFYKGVSFAEYMESLPGNGMARFLIKDFIDQHGDFDAVLETGPDALADATLTGLIDKALGRYFAIYYCPLQAVADDLSARFDLPPMTVQKTNESRADLEFDIGCSEDEFLAHVRRQTWLDIFVLERARAIFPAHVTEEVLTPDAALAALKSRYTLQFRATV
ncbi:MAG: hypothetical protein D6754_15955 [Alphaproteobacteria bacterium]|nr:MAG: hypothetical protein D6754_15955 [Alphaproteobacteria bacterium]